MLQVAVGRVAQDLDPVLKGLAEGTAVLGWGCLALGVAGSHWALVGWVALDWEVAGREVLGREG